jgi:2-keto-4-pentenoate hydratase/2-oxohepta-3-ene-1,7-dioic acid hydratase in catechol pathway
MLAGTRWARLPLPGRAGADPRAWGLAAAIEALGPLEQWPEPAEAEWADADGISFGGPCEPRTIIGVGLNFVPHAADLQANLTKLPTLFFKGCHTVIGPGDTIPLPAMSQRVTAEAELGLVIGRRMNRVAPDEALSYVAGGCCVLDQTAEDILQQDPRMLTISKNFAGFFSFGPEIVSLDELAAVPGGLAGITVETCLNGRPVRTAQVAQMRFSPAELLSFVSQLMPLECGDVVSTGTPGAVVLAPGDVAECRIDGLRPLANPVGLA